MFYTINLLIILFFTIYSSSFNNTIHVQLCLKKIGTITPNDSTQVDDSLRQWLGLTTIPSDQILELAQKVLTRHIRSEEEISSIIREIRNQAVGNQT
jgi:hypothetical protein